MTRAGRPAGPELGQRLVAWYRQERRDLPWRRVTDPYAILVAEIMLQQTQVETVIPYWQRFMARFPTVQALADAEEAEVLRVWEGLGYYRRARYLHATARRVVAEHGGSLPADPTELRRLPGIGPYTAAAVASIAFNRPAAAMDGNAARVAARLFAVDEEVDRAAVRRRLGERLLPAVPAGEAGAFTQALMELGSQICRPGQPQCDACPLVGACRAHATGRQDELPRRTDRARPRPVERVAAAIAWPDGLLVYRRPEGGLLGGLWALPDGERRGSEPGTGAVRRILWDRFQVAVTVDGPCAELQHRFSHQTWRVQLFRCAMPGDGLSELPRLGDGPGPTGGAEGERLLLWRVPRQALSQLPMGGPDRKLLAAVAEGDGFSALTP